MSGNLYLPAKPDNLIQKTKSDGLNYTWVAPTGVTDITIQLQGAGGKGGNDGAPIGAGGGGGGGGSYYSASVVVVPGDTYQFNSGAANSGDAKLTNNTAVLDIVTAAGGVAGTVGVTGTPANGGAGGTVTVHDVGSITTTIDNKAGGAGGHGCWDNSTAGAAGGDVIVDATITRFGGAAGTGAGIFSHMGGGGAGASYSANGGEGQGKSSPSDAGGPGGGGAGYTTPATPTDESTGRDGTTGKFTLIYELQEGITDSDLNVI